MKVTNSRSIGMKHTDIQHIRALHQQLPSTITQYEFLDILYKDQQSAPVSSTEAKVSSLLCNKNDVSHGFPLSAYYYTALQHPVA